MSRIVLSESKIKVQVDITGTSEELEFKVKHSCFEETSFLYPVDEDASEATISDAKAVQKNLMKLLNSDKPETKIVDRILEYEEALDKLCGLPLFGGETYNGWIFDFHFCGWRDLEIAMVETILYCIGKATTLIEWYEHKDEEGMEWEIGDEWLIREIGV